MEIKSLLEEFDKLNLPKGQYVITSSATLAVRGLREARDLDVLVTDEVWKDLTKKYPPDKEFPFIINIGKISLLTKGSVFRDQGIASLDELIKTAEVIDGYPFVSLDYIKKFKRKLGREKIYKMLT